MTELVKQLVVEIDEICNKVFILNIYKVYRLPYCCKRKELYARKIFLRRKILEEYSEGLLQYMEKNNLSKIKEKDGLGYCGYVYYICEIEEVLVDKLTEYEDLGLEQQKFAILKTI